MRLMSIAHESWYIIVDRTTKYDNDMENVCMEVHNFLPAITPNSFTITYTEVWFHLLVPAHL